MQTGFYFGGGGHPTFVSVQCESRGNVMDWLWGGRAGGGGDKPPKGFPLPKSASLQVEPFTPPPRTVVRGGKKKSLPPPQKCEPY